LVAAVHQDDLGNVLQPHCRLTVSTLKFGVLPPTS
jgi:hypothetical protein